MLAFVDVDVAVLCLLLACLFVSVSVSSRSFASFVHSLDGVSLSDTVDASFPATSRTRPPTGRRPASTMHPRGSSCGVLWLALGVGLFSVAWAESGADEACSCDGDAANTTANVTGLDAWAETVGTVGAATIVVSVPAFAMMMGSIVIAATSCIVPDKTQAVLQNLSAGIIIAATAGELFPLLESSDGGGNFLNTLGMTVGFLAALGAMFLIRHFNDRAAENSAEEATSQAPWERTSGAEGDRRRVAVATDSTESAGASASDPGDHDGGFDDTPTKDPEAGVELTAAPASHQTRVTTEGVYAQIETHSSHMEESINLLERELDAQSPSRYSIDSLIHRYQAVLDSARRHLSGEDDDVPEPVREELGETIQHLRENLGALREKLRSDEKSPQQLHSLVLSAEDRIESIHRTVDPHYASFRNMAKSAVARSKTQPKPERVPVTLAVAVYVDSFVDGFLIGLSYTATPHAGFILSGAAVIEMCVLGMTFTAILKASLSNIGKVTALAMTAPSVMLIAGALGSAIGSVVASIPPLFIGFVAFAVVCLLFLVTQELLIEAMENQNGDQIWWVSLFIFVGVFIVLFLESVLHQLEG